MYRYGFNGKENDSEVKGEGNSVAYENRIYDTRLGRWLSLDPLQAKYPGESHYNFVSNSPIFFKDIDGRDKYETITIHTKSGKVIELRKTTANYFKYKVTISATNAWNKTVQYEKADVYTNIIIDEANPDKNSYKESVGAYSTTTWWQYSVFSDWSLGKDESASIKYGFHIYGGGIKDEGWQNKLPKASDGSESLDLGKFFELTSSLHSQLSSKSIQEDYKIVNKTVTSWVKGQEVTDFFDKLNNLLNEKKISPIQSPIKENRSEQFDPSTIMYPHAPNSNGKIESWSGLKSTADSSWARFKRSNPKSKATPPPPKTLKQIQAIY